VEGLRSRLLSLNPLAVLQRGYALVQAPDGRLLTRIRQVASGADVSVRMSDGSFDASVRQVKPAQAKDS